MLRMKREKCLFPAAEMQIFLEGKALFEAMESMRGNMIVSMPAVQEKAKAESPFGTTIAHGYLTLSMLPYLWDQIIDVNNLERMMNYGMDKMKFNQPVLSGQHIRMTTKLEELANLRGAIKTTIKFTIEIQETGKKALEGLATFIYYFKK